MLVHRCYAQCEGPRNVTGLDCMSFMNRISKFLWHFLRLLECITKTIPYLYVGVLELFDMQKGGFQRMVYGE